MTKVKEYHCICGHRKSFHFRGKCMGHIGRCKCKEFKKQSEGKD